MRYLLCVLILICLSSCAYIDTLIELKEKDKKTDPIPKKEPEKKPKKDPKKEPDKYSNWMHHTNGDCHLEARKTACVILCPGQKAKTCEMNGKPMKKHGAQDRGRDVWLGPWPAGDITCTIKGKKYRYRVDKGMHFGECK